MNKEEIEREIEQIEGFMNKSDFWDDPKTAQQKIKRFGDLKKILDGEDKFNNCEAIINIYAGAGGDDAEDFVRILFEMYQNFCEKNTFSLKVLNETPNSQKGFRNISFLVSSKNAYKKLKNESGVFRLVRKSPFNAKSKRQTSFCLVDVLSKIKQNDFSFDIKEVEISFTKSSGAGGQNVNKRETAVRVVHPKTGLSFVVSAERTQERNKEIALEMIRSALYKKHKEDEEKKDKGLSISDKVKIEWGSQKRSFIFDPYCMVKDHHKNIEVNDVQKVLDGNLEDFIK